MNAQGVSPTKITFKRSPPVVIKSNGTERTGMDTHLAADTKVVVNDGSHMLTIPIDSLLGAGCRAGCVLAMLTGEGQILTVSFHL